MFGQSIKLIPCILMGGISYTICNDIYERYFINKIKNEKIAITYKFILNKGSIIGLIFGYIKNKIISFE